MGGAALSPRRVPRPTQAQWPAVRAQDARAELAAICGLYTYALDLALIDRHPRGHGKRLRVDAKRAQGAAALSKAEFERFVAVAREHSPNALAIVLLLGLYGLRVSEVCELQLEQLDWNHGQPVLRVAGKGRAANETAMFPVPHDVRQALQRAAGERERGPLLLKASNRPYVRPWTRTARLVAEHDALRTALGCKDSTPSEWACYRFTAKLRAYKPLLDSCITAVLDRLRDANPGIP